MLYTLALFSVLKLKLPLWAIKIYNSCGQERKSNWSNVSLIPQPSHLKTYDALSFKNIFHYFNIISDRGAEIHFLRCLWLAGVEILVRIMSSVLTTDIYFLTLLKLCWWFWQLRSLRGQRRSSTPLLSAGSELLSCLLAVISLPLDPCFPSTCCWSSKTFLPSAEDAHWQLSLFKTSLHAFSVLEWKTSLH